MLSVGPLMEADVVHARMPEQGEPGEARDGSDCLAAQVPFGRCQIAHGRSNACDRSAEPNASSLS